MKTTLMRLIPWCAGLILAGCTVFVALQLHWAQEDTIHRANLSILKTAELNFNSVLKVEHLAMSRMANRWAFTGGTERTLWEADALHYMEDIPFLQAIKWVDTTGRVRWIVPEDGNEAALKENLNENPKIRIALEKAKATRSVQLTGSVELVRGGNGYMAIAPIRAADTFSGYIVAVNRTRGLLQHLAHDIPTMHSVELIENGVSIGQFVKEGTKVGGDRVEQTHVHVTPGGEEWTLSIQPTLAYIKGLNSHISEVVFVAGILLAILVAFAMTLYQSLAVQKQRIAAATLIESANMQLTRVNQELEQFVYTASHDLKSPIVTIHGFLGRLRTSVERGDEAKTHDALQRIEKAASRMREHVDDLLALSRVGRIANDPESFELEELIREIVTELEPQISARDINVHIASDLPVVFADRERLRQVVANLMTNAIRYGCDGAEPRIDIGSCQDDHQTTFYVRDNGPGIAPEYHDKVFKLFERLSRDTTGTGVGLAIVNRIVEAHGGRVWLESSVGHGATFWVSLPRVSDDGSECLKESEQEPVLMKG